MDLPSGRHGAVEDGRRRATADAIAVMRAIEVVEVQEVPEAAIERGTARDVVAPEYHAPVLGEDGLLQTLDKAIGPGVGSTSWARERSSSESQLS